MLSELERDLLVETVNTNLGKAASLLSEMVGQRVLLTVPEVDLRNGDEFSLKDYQGMNGIFRTSVLSSMRFGKIFSGNIYLVLPADRVKELVAACTGGEAESGDSNYDKLTMEDMDVIREISNIIFNSMIGEFANLLDIRLEYTLPQTEMIGTDGEDGVLPGDIHFLTTHASFTLAESKLKGLLFLTLSANSEKMLLERIDEILVNING